MTTDPLTRIHDDLRRMFPRQKELTEHDVDRHMTARANVRREMDKIMAEKENEK